jgi:hypothetical protein
MALLARDALVSIAHRRAAALNYRLQGHNYAAMPSKFYAIAAAGRPIIAICSKDGEIARRIDNIAAARSWHRVTSKPWSRPFYDSPPNLHW